MPNRPKHLDSFSDSSSACLFFPMVIFEPLPKYVAPHFNFMKKSISIRESSQDI